MLREIHSVPGVQIDIIMELFAVTQKDFVHSAIQETYQSVPTFVI